MISNVTRSVIAFVLVAFPTALPGADVVPPPSPVVPPRRPADFKPYRYEYTTEQLREKFSDDQMKRAALAWKEIQTVNEKGPWKPTWESIDKHQGRRVVPRCQARHHD